MDIYECVAGGVKFLDEVRPGWRELVDVDRLDIADPYHCVLGQVFAAEAAADPHLPNGFSWAHREFKVDERDFAWTSNLGFAGGANVDLDYHVELASLTAAWKKELAA